MQGNAALFLSCYAGPVLMKSAAVMAWVGALCLAAHAGGSPQQIFDRAAQALRDGDYPAAESGFRQVLKQDPRNPGALGNLGVVYSRTHRFGKAIEVYKQGLRMSPKDPGLLLNTGLAYLKQNDYAHAIPYFRGLHTLQPENSQATTLLSTCLVFGGQPAAAILLLKPAVEKAPDSANLYILGVAYGRTGQVEAGKQVFAKLLTSADTHASACFILGQAYYDSRLFEQAVQSFHQVLQSDPRFPGAHRELGKVYVSLRQNADAEKELRLAVQQDPQDAVAVYFLGGLLVQTDRYAEGVPFLEQARSLDPDSWATYLYLGKAKFKLNEHDAAVRYLRQAGDMNPEEPMIFYLLASALRAEGHTEEARAALQRVSDLHMTSLEADRKAHDAMVAGAR